MLVKFTLTLPSPKERGETPFPFGGRAGDEGEFSNRWQLGLIRHSIFYM